MKQLVQFSLSDGRKFLAEVDELTGSSTEPIALHPGQLAIDAKQSFEEALDTIKPIASTISSKLHSLAKPADEVEVRFGLKLSAEAGAILTSIGGEVNYEITLKWKKDDSE